MDAQGGKAFSFTGVTPGSLIVSQHLPLLREAMGSRVDLVGYLKRGGNGGGRDECRVGLGSLAEGVRGVSVVKVHYMYEILKKLIKCISKWSRGKVGYDQNILSEILRVNKNTLGY